MKNDRINPFIAWVCAIVSTLFSYLKKRHGIKIGWNQEHPAPPRRDLKAAKKAELNRIKAEIEMYSKRPDKRFKDGTERGIDTV